jgi:hypothetical protein
MVGINSFVGATIVCGGASTRPAPTNMVGIISFGVATNTCTTKVQAAGWLMEISPLSFQPPVPAVLAQTGQACHENTGLCNDIGYNLWEYAVPASE